MTLKEFVVNERVKREFTISDFSKATGVTSPVLGKIEKGYVPTQRTIGKILNYLGYEYSEAKEFIDNI